MSDGQDWEEAFAVRLARLVDGQDRAALAALRRGLGKAPGEAPEMFPLVVPWIPAGFRPADEEAVYLVASLVGFHPARITGLNLAASWHRASLESASSEAQFVAVLNADREDLAPHLRRMIGILRAHGVPWDWAQLIRDLRRWEHPRRVVQRRWASAYWGTAHDAAPEAIQEGTSA